jgi:glycerophosphoryl diester phosphodiesterase
MPDPGPEKNLVPLVTKLDPAPRVIATVMRYCSPTFVETAHARGAIVITDEGDRDDWPALLEWGNDGIQTDHPADLIALLESRRKN